MRTAIRLAAFKVAGGLAVVVMHGLLVRQIGEQDYGYFALFQTCFLVLATLTNGGWMHGIVLMISRYGLRKRWERFRGALIQANLVAILLSVAVAIPIYLMTPLIFSDPAQIAAFRLGLAVVPFQAVIMVSKGVFRGLHMPLSSILPDEVALPIVTIAIFAAFTVGGFWEACLAYAIATAVICVLSVIWAWISVPDEVRAARPSYVTRAWNAYTMPLIAGEAGNVIISRGDIIMLSALSTPEQTAHYAMGVRLGATLMLGQSLILPLYGGRFSAARIERDHAKSRQLLVEASLMASGLALVPALVLIIYPQIATLVFGDAANNALWPIRIIAMAYFFHTATGPLALFAQMQGKHRVYSIIAIAAAFVNIALNFVLVPKYGAVGAACTTLAVFAVWKGLLIYQLFTAWRNELIGPPGERKQVDDADVK